MLGVKGRSKASRTATAVENDLLLAGKEKGEAVVALQPGLPAPLGSSEISPNRHPVGRPSLSAKPAARASRASPMWHLLAERASVSYLCFRRQHIGPGALKIYAQHRQFAARHWCSRHDVLSLVASSTTHAAGAATSSPHLSSTRPLPSPPYADCHISVTTTTQKQLRTVRRRTDPAVNVPAADPTSSRTEGPLSRTHELGSTVNLNSRDAMADVPNTRQEDDGFKTHHTPWYRAYRLVSAIFHLWGCDLQREPGSDE